MSVVSRTTQGGADFELLCTGAVRNYSFNPANLAGQTEAEGIKKKLITQLEDTVRELELQSDRTIAKIYIGKTYIQRRKKPGGGKGHQTFDPLNSNTWRKKGISSRWNDHKKQDYGRDGLVVLGAITRETMPERCSQVNQEDFALAMEQQLLHHYRIFKPDPRVVNETFSTGQKTKNVCYAYAVYMAFRYEDDSYSEEEPMDTSPSFPAQTNETDQSTFTHTTPPRPILNPLSDMNSMQLVPPPATIDNIALIPSSSTSLMNPEAVAALSAITSPRKQAVEQANPCQPILPTSRTKPHVFFSPYPTTRFSEKSTCSPSSPRGKGILKNTPEKPQHHQPSASPSSSAVRTLNFATPNGGILPLVDQQLEKADLRQTAHTTTSSGSSYTSLQYFTAYNIQSQTQLLASVSDPQYPTSHVPSSPQSSLIDSISVTLTAGGSLFKQQLGIQVNLQQNVNETLESSVQNVLQSLSSQDSPVTTSTSHLMQCQTTPTFYSTKRDLELTQIKSTMTVVPSIPSSQSSSCLPGYLPLPKNKTSTPNAGRLTKATGPSHAFCPSSSGKQNAQDRCEVITISDSDSDNDGELIIIN